MALSEKVALLGCLGFIFGMCWLVTLVARPMVDLPTPLVARGPRARPGGGTVFVADSDSRRGEGGGSALVANRFARPSPTEVNASPGQWNGDALRLAETLPPGSGWEDDALPPLHVPEAAVVAMADETTPDPAELPEAAGPLRPETPLLEAVVSAAPAPEAGCWQRGLSTRSRVKLWRSRAARSQRRTRRGGRQRSRRTR